MATVIEVPLDQLPAALEHMETSARRAIAQGALAGAHRGRAVIVKRTPTDQGQLRAGWKVKPGATDFALGTDPVLATLVNDAPHIAMVELGSRPHKMSPEGWAAIYEWVRRHFRGGTLGGAGRMKRPAKNSVVGIVAYRGDDPEISKITNAVVHRIAVKGTAPTFFIKNSIAELRAVMIDEVKIALKHASAETKP